jgi:hypothetical protein
MDERLAVVQPAIEPVIEPVVEPVIDPAMEPVAEPVIAPQIEAQLGPEAPPAAAAMEPEPAALPEVTYGSSGVAEEVAPPSLPGFMKRKRGKRRKSGPHAPAPDRSPPEDGPSG